MGLTSEVDTKLLHQCFELDHYDNLLKPEFMDAIRKRREYLIWEEKVRVEKERVDFKKKMKDETMRCNVIAQRIALQEHLVREQEGITREIEEWLADEEKLKSLDKAKVEDLVA